MGGRPSDALVVWELGGGDCLEGRDEGREERVEGRGRRGRREVLGGGRRDEEEGGWDEEEGGEGSRKKPASRLRDALVVWGWGGGEGEVGERWRARGEGARVGVLGREEKRRGEEMN